MIIIGIDPGSVVTGVGVIESINGVFKVLDYDALFMSSKTPMPVRLKTIYDFCIKKINLFKPNQLALETAFFGKNIQSTLKLGQVRGVIMVASMNSGVDVFEYSPREIKKSVTGNGASTKQTVQIFIKNILSMKVNKILNDSSDALAIALCHHYNGTNKVIYSARTKKTNWKDFIDKNPDKIYRRQI
ncbi:MAG: crossover junction endodeoxyribonuclease RuvC [Ignavibacteria bacterium]